MSAIIYDTYFKRFGVKSPQYLMSPLMPSLDKWAFPKDAIHHYVVYDNVSVAPPSDEYIYRDIGKKIFVEHITTLSDFKGNPKKLSISLLQDIREYHNRNKRFRYAEDIAVSVKDENTLAVINYGFMSKSYRYIRSFYTEYFKWWNIEKTVWNQVAKLTETSNRHQFIFINLPKTVPSVSKLDLYSTTFNQEFIKTFGSGEYLFILEMWKWLSAENRDKSVLGDLSQEALNKINLVLQDSGRFILLNLGTINSWRYVADKETDPAKPIETQKIKIDAKSLQKRFLRMLMSMMETRVAPKEVEEETTETSSDDSDESTVNTVSNITEVTITDDEILSNIDNADKDLDIDVIQSRLELSNQLLEDLDKDLEVLEVIEKQRADSIVIDEDGEDKKKKENVVFKDKTLNLSFFNIDKSPEEMIEDACGVLADDGLLSAAEYRKILKSAVNYKSIISMDGKTTLDKYVDIDPSEIKISGSATTVDRETIIDKTMLKSSLIDFDEKYITKIMSRDIVSMGVAIQKAGLIINRYEVEDVEDILGKYQMHTIRVSPVQGANSILRFRVPVVDEDGSYTSNGIRYRLRKQRIDLPIRKTAPDKVSLTSYYGKTFVTRSEKRVHDYGHWLRTEIMKRGVDISDNSVLNLVPVNVFTNNVNLPRTYTAISQSIKEFTSNAVTFSFDYEGREKIFTVQQMAQYEKDGSVLVGITTTDDIVFMDKNNALYGVSEGIPELLGTMESYLKLDTNNTPVDYAQVKVYGKNLPLAIVMGYQYGLQTLIDVLKADVRRVAAGQRLNLQEHEYSVAFSDETLVFSKDDTIATMIFAGFRDYARHIKNYSVYTFDKPNVYLNVLDSNGIGARFLRELDLMDKLFVDPITKEILVEMNEPTTFRGLLIRSAELLLKDSHPDALDMEFMRIRGYERFAGAAYSEMVIAVREHNSRSGKSNYPIEMNPYSVWKRITQDPSISMVSDINPIENLKQQEAVTYSGVGGRMGRSMTKSSRAYHPNDMGVISESTSDSSDVAINTYTSADPQFISLRGRAGKYVIGKTGPTALLSTSALISIGTDTDD